MKPTIGRIVHYNSRQGPCAALVVNVLLDDVTVDLQVFDIDGGIRYVSTVEQGKTMGSWNWPPRA